MVVRERWERDEIGIANRRGLDAFKLFESRDNEGLARRYVKHLTQVKDWIDAELMRLHRTYPQQFPPILADISEAIEMAKAICRLSDNVQKAMAGGGRIMYREHVRTCFDLYEAIYLQGHSHVVAYGGTNLGKTSCSHFLRFITGPLNAIVRSVMTCIINVYIPRRTVIEQATASFYSLIDLYGLIKFVNDDVSLGLSDYHMKLTNGLWQNDVEGKRKNDLNQSRTKDEIREIATRAEENQCDLLTEIDEVHYAPKTSGQLGRKIKSIDPVLADSDEDDDSGGDSDENGIGATTLEDVRNTVRNVVAFSATPDPNLKGPWHLVKMHFDPAYASTHQYFLGEQISDKLIPVLSFWQFERLSGIDLSLIDSRRLNSYKKRRTNAFARQCYQRMLEALNWCYTQKLRPHLGSFVRMEAKNDDADKFAEYVEAHSDIKVVRYYGVDNKENIRDQLAQFIKRKQKFCIVPTAACRMADDLPPEVCYFFDITHRTTYPTALRQSTPGRASGHDKVSFIVMSDRNAAAIEADNIALGWPTKAPSQHTSLNTAGSQTLAVQMRVEITPDWPPELIQALAPFQTQLLREARQKLGHLPTHYENTTARFVATRGALPDISQHFRTLLGMLRTEALRQKPHLDDVVLLGVDGDEMVNYTGPLEFCFDTKNPYSFRDRKKVDDGGRSGTGHNMLSKAWRGKGGMIVQFLWDVVNEQGERVMVGNTGSLKLVEIIWPIKHVSYKAATALHGNLPVPKPDTWQADVNNAFGQV